MARTVVIRPVLNGFVCEVGCQTVVFNSLDRICELLKEYYTNPDALEKSFLDKAPSWYKPNTVLAQPPSYRGEDAMQEAVPITGGSCGRE